MVRSFLVAALLASPPALSAALSAELTVGKGSLAVNLFGELELSPDETYLTACYGLTRSPPIEGYVDPSDPSLAVPPLTPAPNHQLCLGLDHAFSRHWLVSSAASFSPATVDRITLRAPDGRQAVLATGRQSMGLSLAAAYESAGLSSLEWGVDGSLNGTLHRLTRGVDLPLLAPVFRTEPLVVVRPSLGVVLVIRDDTEVSLRGTYFWYSSDPVTAGRFSDEQLEAIGARLAPLVTRVADPLRAIDLVATRLYQADAVSGFTSAPIQVESRLTLSHRFGSRLRGQLAYTFDRHVPGEGFSHVLSTKWTVRLTDALRAWAALAVQHDEPLDQPELRQMDDPRPSRSGLLTVGAEVSL